MKCRIDGICLPSLGIVYLPRPHLLRYSKATPNGNLVLVFMDGHPLISMKKASKSLPSRCAGPFLPKREEQDCVSKVLFSEQG